MKTAAGSSRGIHQKIWDGPSAGADCTGHRLALKKKFMNSKFVMAKAVEIL